MIKFVAGSRTPGNLPIFGMGIVAGNVELLMAGKPIKVDGKLYGLSHDILLFYGSTEQTIVDDLEASGIALPTPKADPDPSAP